MALIPPHFMNSVVAIGNRDDSGVISWVASGFFYGRFREELNEGNRRYGTFLVTNKHVLQGLSDPVVRANPVGTEPAREIGLAIQDEAGVPVWVGHPDPEIDVVVTGVGLDAMRNMGLEVSFFQDEHAATLEKMQELGMSEGDALFLFGFPMGMVGGPRSAAVVRGGTMAQLQGAYAGAAKSYIVDGYVFPGNSGGPVVSKPEMISIDGTAAVGSAFLIGIVSSYVSYQDVAVSTQTGRNRVVFEENSGLSNVFPIEAIDQTVDVWDLAHPESRVSEIAPASDVPTIDE